MESPVLVSVLRLTPLLLLLLLRLSAASRKHGCLFEDDLCELHEVCINNGVFGQCQRFPVSELYTYDASPAALQRLRNLLQQLTQQGYTWQDDATQQVISRELLALPKIPLRRLGKNLPAFKLRAQTNDDDNRKYLQKLGFLPAEITSSKQGLQGNYKSKGVSDLMDLIMESNKRPPPPPSTSLLQTRPGPKKSYSWTRLKPVDQPELLDRTGLLSELQQYLTEPKERPAGPSQEKLQYFSLQHSPTAKAGNVPGASRRPPRPRIDKLLFRSGAKQPTPQDSLSSVDEKFIQGLVKQLGQQNMDTLTLNDLDQLSEVITQALQVVDDVDGVKDREVMVNDEGEMKKKLDPEGQLGKMSGEEFMSKDGKTKEIRPESEGKDKVLISQLLDFLDRNSSPEAADHPRDEKSLLGSFNHSQTPAGLKSAGVEIVQSRTTQTSVDLTKKKMEPDTVDLQPAGDAEVEHWLHGEKAVKAEAQRKESSAEEEDVEKKFRVDVTAYSTPQHDGYFGYIVTQHSLSTDQGLNLMETLAKRANLRVTDFLQLSVLGPAVTFRVKPNAGNITTALLARVAVDQKGQLEKESGVKILEAGLSDVSLEKHFSLYPPLPLSDIMICCLPSMHHCSLAK
ncbi:receptor-type tyrosine-protein phosphatase N2-like [Ictalurus furcatus]|uniref:receptor-type tyrosine-protein phosphatase N2-like n=1 Tax=Ictalurus furcatus TaxID=66913 RepID=UPI0023501652|nr:receptor-type tyrosine-protein phosphatase N2-like [Ictalurus furcatus]